jgi:hypothetical protein
LGKILSFPARAKVLDSSEGSGSLERMKVGSIVRVRGTGGGVLRIGSVVAVNNNQTEVQVYAPSNRGGSVWFPVDHCEVIR